MQSEFTTPSDGRKYSVDLHGVIHQVDARPFKYNGNYIATYDTPEYKSKALQLQALRHGFVCAAHWVPPASLLDFGCGNGEFLRYIENGIENLCGYDIAGIERFGNIPVQDKLIKMEVYTFWDSLEHVPNLDFIKDLPCDTVCISLPNCEPHSVADFDAWYHRKPDEHLHHFNSSSLGSMMRFYGWTSVALSHHEDLIRKRETMNGSWNILSMAFKRI